MIIKKLFIILTFSFLCLYACTNVTKEKVSTKESPIEKHAKLSVKSANQAPDFTLKNIYNENVSLSSFDGKVIILNFWATWCPPCQAEIPDFIELYSMYKNSGVVIIGVAMDGDGGDVVKSFAEQKKINYPILLGNDNIGELYGGIRGIPTTFIINKQREIVETFVGLRDMRTFEHAIRKNLR
ncbi:redoxin domain-containing protein [Candidatus Desantisbacteria bacterium]|nr:redoxin domain-containing protein [Candidatus Desantisbacteria bacterium]